MLDGALEEWVDSRDAESAASGMDQIQRGFHSLIPTTEAAHAIGLRQIRNYDESSLQRRVLIAGSISGR